jgi:hypothetical protein
MFLIYDTRLLGVGVVIMILRQFSQFIREPLNH